MTFEEMVEQLNGRGIMVSSVGQIEDGKRWSVSVLRVKKWENGYGVDKKLERAFQKALSSLRNTMTESDWKKVAKNPTEKKKRKRTRLSNRKRR